MNPPSSRTRARLALGAEIAIKLIDGRLARDVEYRLRWMCDLTAAARVRSAHVVRILDHGFTTGGRGFIVTERLHGEDLACRLARPPPLTLEEVNEIVAGACAGLAAGHELGVVHGRLEPSHLFIVASDDDTRIVKARVKLLEFGVSGAGSPGVDARPYSSPEDLAGGAIDVRADLYSLAVLAYRCLTGHLPFEGRSEPIEENDALRSAFDPRLSDALNHWFEGMLRRDPDARRCQSVRELERAFTLACGVTGRSDTDVRVGEAPAPSAQWKPRTSERERPSASPHALAPAGVCVTRRRVTARRRRWMEVALGCLAAVIIAAGGAILGFELRHLSEEKPTPPAAPPSIPGPPEPAAPRAVHLSVRVSPLEAILLLDGQRLDSNPYFGTRPADESSHRLRAEAPGYEDVEREISLSRDLMVEFALSPVAVLSTGVPSPHRMVRAAPPSLPTGPTGRARPERWTPRPSPAEPKTMRPLSVDRTNPWQDP